MISVSRKLAAYSVGCVLSFLGTFATLPTMNTLAVTGIYVTSSAYAGEPDPFDIVEVALIRTKGKVVEIDRLTKGTAHLEVASALLAIDSAYIALSLAQLDPRDENVTALDSAMSDLSKALQVLLTAVP